MKKMFVFAGSWGFSPGPKGLHIYSYEPETARMEYVRTLREDIAVGYQYLDEARRVLYITDESGRPRNGAVGGYVLALALDGEHILVEKGGKETLLPKPSYFWLDYTGDYALVAHHSNRGQVTKLARGEDGSFFSKTVTDDAGLALFTVEKDGSLGELVDYALTPGKEPYGPHASSHEHCVAASPDGELFLVCDKGLDCIYSFRLDRDEGRLKLLQTTDTEPGSAPRYVVFHPALPVVYENNERRSVLHTYGYDSRTGRLTRLNSLPLCAEGAGEGMQPAALALSPDGTRLYASVRGAETISVLELDSSGIPHILQTISCGGENPRGLCLSPDGRFLLCANTDSGSITRFSVAKDGTLTPEGEPVAAHIPGNLVIAAV